MREVIPVSKHDDKFNKKEFVIIIKGNKATLASVHDNGRIIGGICPCCTFDENLKEIEAAVTKLIGEGVIEKVIWPDLSPEKLSQYKQLTPSNYAEATTEEIDDIIFG